MVRSRTSCLKRATELPKDLVAPSSDHDCLLLSLFRSNARPLVWYQRPKESLLSWTILSRARHGSCCCLLWTHHYYHCHFDTILPQWPPVSWACARDTCQSRQVAKNSRPRRPGRRVVAKIPRRAPWSRLAGHDPRPQRAVPTWWPDAGRGPRDRRRNGSGLEGGKLQDDGQIVAGGGMCDRFLCLVVSVVLVVILVGGDDTELELNVSQGLATKGLYRGTGERWIRRKAGWIINSHKAQEISLRRRISRRTGRGVWKRRRRRRHVSSG